jgi:hypothetical protein
MDTIGGYGTFAWKAILKKHNSEQKRRGRHERSGYSTLKKKFNHLLEGTVGTQAQQNEAKRIATHYADIVSSSLGDRTAASHAPKYPVHDEDMDTIARASLHVSYLTSTRTMTWATVGIRSGAA